MMELEKMHALTTENFCNLGAYHIIEILLILHSAHVVSQNQDKLIFYINHYLNYDQFN